MVDTPVYPRHYVTTVRDEDGYEVPINRQNLYLEVNGDDEFYEEIRESQMMGMDDLDQLDAYDYSDIQ